jgi:hypothetical protein
MFQHCKHFWWYTYLLHDIAVGAAGPSNAETHVVISKIILSKLAEFLVKGGRKHHVSVIIVLVEVLEQVSKIVSKYS